LNHIRLAGANIESKPFPIKDGDILQLGVDYQGGTEEIYRCVKIRVELNRGWQREANQFK
jgi:pSer/pThr/pTyr-binding forkhead associated (FHA) protein